MGNEFTFDKKTHTYRINGKIIPGVTQILSDEGLFSYLGVPPETMEAARKFGAAAHKACELYDKGILDEKSLSEPLIPYLAGWKKFLDDFKPIIYPDWIEKPICSYKYQFGTTQDRVMSVNSKVTIVEIKTTTIMQPAVAIQTAGQAIAVEEWFGKVKQCMAVRLLPDGTYKIEIYDNLADKTIFISALHIWRWKRENL